VALLGRETGRFRSLAKGSKRGRNPFDGPLDRWTLGEAVFSLRDPNRLATLMELYAVERFDGLRVKLPAFFGAALVTELLLALVPEADPSPRVFDLSVGTLRRLAAGEPEAAPAVAFAFAWRLLDELGYGVDLGRCVQCDAPIGEDAGVAFSGALGGAVCPRCTAPDRTVKLSARAARAMMFLAGAAWDEVERVRLTKPTADALRRAFAVRAEELAGRQLSALRYV
jgi:DNA repair protein RecO